jgi:hypothetical protein
MLAQPVVPAGDAARKVPCVEREPEEHEVVVQPDGLALEAQAREEAQGDENEGEHEEHDADGVIGGGA